MQITLQDVGDSKRGVGESLAESVFSLRSISYNRQSAFLFFSQICKVYLVRYEDSIPLNISPFVISSGRRICNKTILRGISRAFRYLYSPSVGYAAIGRLSLQEYVLGRL